MQHIGHRPYVEVHLWLYSSADESAEESSPATEERVQRLAQQSAEVRAAEPAPMDTMLRTQRMAADIVEGNLVLAE